VLAERLATHRQGPAANYDLEVGSAESP